MTTKLAIEVTEVDVAPATAVTIEGQCHVSDIAATMGPIFNRLAAFLAATGTPTAGPPRAVYTGMDQGQTTFIVAFPIAKGAREERGDTDIRIRELPSGPAWRFVHRGPYQGLAATYDTITSWLQARGLIADEGGWIEFMPMWEEYVSDPATTPPEALLTYIYLPRQ